MSLDLPAGGFGNAARFEEPDVLDSQVMVLGDRLAHRLYYLIGSRVSMLAIELGRYHQLLSAAQVDRKGGATSRPDGGMALLHCQFDILWIMILTLDNDQIFQPASDKQLAIQNEPQISGS
jgi:hypothetical protein